MMQQKQQRQTNEAKGNKVQQDEPLLNTEGGKIKNFKYKSDMTDALFEKAYAEGDEMNTKQELQLKVDEEGNGSSD